LLARTLHDSHGLLMHFVRVALFRDDKPVTRLARSTPHLPRHVLALTTVRVRPHCSVETLHHGPDTDAPVTILNSRTDLALRLVVPWRLPRVPPEALLNLHHVSV